MTNKNNLFSLSCALLAVIAMSGCAKLKSGEAKFPSGLDRTTTGDDIYGDKGSILGKDGFTLFGKGKKSDKGESGIAINSYLWRASLDTISFMPLASADPFGGVIITDWYASPEKPNERFKANVFILDKQLVSNGVSVKIFRQQRTNNDWTDSAVADDTATKLEDAILTRARQLRVAELDE